MTEKSDFDQHQVNRGLQEARNVLQIEAESVLSLKESIDGDFAGVIKLILKNKGRVIFTGVGKSGLIGRKLAATFSSTGTPAFFVHAGEAQHGDMGMVTENDIIMAISNSGETDEILQLIPAIKRIGARLVALTGNNSSTLAGYADLCLLTGVEEEACPHGLAPTASTTAAMALGDALAIALSTIQGFTSKDFALFHPGGQLGRKLLTRVKDVLEIRNQNPTVNMDTTVKEALFLMTNSRMGSTSIIDNEGYLVGIMTDGDIRRLLEKSNNFLERPVKEYMTVDPVTIEVNQLATEALKIMEDREINDLPAVKDKKPVGMLNFQDLLRARVF